MICPTCLQPLPAEWASGDARCARCGVIVLGAPRLGVPAGSAVLGPRDGDVADYPLIDHEHSLRRLKAAWRRAHEGRGQLVSLVGELGCGRSRLIRELGRSIDEQAPDALWLLAGGRSYATYVAYGLLAQLFAPWTRRGADGDEGGGVGELAEALEALAGGAGRVDRTDLEAAARQLCAGGGALHPEPLAEVVARALACVAHGRPMVVVLEDLEWSDATSLAVLEALLPPLLEGPTLVLCTHHADWSHEWARVDRHHHLILGPLSAGDSRRLIEVVVGEDRFPAESVGALAAAGDGNPLLLEQLALAAREGAFDARAEADFDAPPLPSTLPAAILARIAVLPAGARDVLVAAATIGQTFPYRAVAAVTDQHPRLDEALRELVRRRFVRRWREGPGREVLYRFTHGLMQEVAYGSLGGAESRVLEARAADWLLREATLADGKADRVLDTVAARRDNARSVQHRGEAVVGGVDTDRLVTLLHREPTPDPAKITPWPFAGGPGSHNAALARITLGDLAPERRAAVILCLQHGYSYADAGELLGLPRDEVRTHLHEARQIFRRLYGASELIGVPATTPEGKVGTS